MFYNNDILSRRKTGLGIVWLAATLGDRSVVRRLTRRDILSVNITKTCQSVLGPSEPLALRLSSQLMFGIVKLYGHQTELLYQDVLHVQSDVRRHVASTVLGTKQIDMRKVSGAIDAITLPLDLTFFALDFDAVTSGLLYRWSVEPPERREMVVEGVEDGFRTPTPMRFLAEEERITLAARGFEEEELGLPRGYAEEEGIGPVFGEEFEEEGFEGLDLGLEPPGPEPFTPGALEGLHREVGDETAITTGPLVEWPELEERLAEEASRMEPGPVVEGVPTVIPALRPREEEEAAEIEALLAPPARRPRPTPRPYEDAATELSETQLRTARADYPSRMAAERAIQRRRREARAADVTVRQMMFGPPEDLALNPLLSDLWQTTVSTHLLSQRARIRAMRDEAGLVPLGAAPPTPPPPTPILVEEEPAEVGVARAATAEAEIPAALRGARESLPWNVFMEHRRRSSMMPSISYERPTFEREVTPLRPREVSVETPTGLRRLPPESPLFPPPSPSTVAPLEEYYPPPETPSVERFRLGLPTAPPPAEVERSPSPTPPAQVFQEEMEEETRNFYEYAHAVQDELQDPTFLFFSDLAPVASSTPAVAAQAFCHTLALASAGRIKVKQDEAYQQIRVSLIAT